jgi:transcriptional regulator with XRE-family HTH domain
MEKEQLVLKLRKKKLGILMKDARVPWERSVEDCARVMAVQPEEYESYENGLRSPSLPQLEAFAYYMSIPMDHFWNEHSISEDFPLKEAEKIRQRNQLRNRFIGTHLHQMREEKGLSADELAEQCGLDSAQIIQYEGGKEPIPLPELEILTRVLKIDIQDLFDRHGKIGEWEMKETSNARFQDLPDDLRDFVSMPVNRPYLELAKRLSEFPTEKLRSIAESLLEITY